MKMGKAKSGKTLRIGLYSDDPKKLNGTYLDLVLNDRFDHSINEQYFGVDYEPSNGSKDRGIVTITGNFNILEICDVLSRTGFRLTSINERKLEDLGNEVLSKLEKIIGEQK